MVTILAPGRGVAKPHRVDLCLELWLVRRVPTLHGCCFSCPRPIFWEPIYLHVKLSDVPQATDVLFCLFRFLEFYVFHFGPFSRIPNLLLIPFSGIFIPESVFFFSGGCTWFLLCFPTL